MLRSQNPGCSPSDLRLFPVLLHSLCALCLFSGCATALKRESQCLVSLTVDVVQAHEEIANLETAWRESLVRRDGAFRSTVPPPDGRLLFAHGTRSAPEGVRQWMAGAQESPILEEARLAARRSYERMVEAKTRHQPLLTMYDKVIQRVRTRTEEETILSEVRTIMLAGPASFVFYPLIRWNVRSILWDGGDPDGATDTVTRFCSNRLEVTPRQPDPADRPHPSGGKSPDSTERLPEHAPWLPAS